MKLSEILETKFLPPICKALRSNSDACVFSVKKIDEGFYPVVRDGRFYYHIKSHGNNAFRTENSKTIFDSIENATKHCWKCFKNIELTPKESLSL